MTNYDSHARYESRDLLSITVPASLFLSVLPKRV